MDSPFSTSAFGGSPSRSSDRSPKTGFPTSMPWFSDSSLLMAKWRRRRCAFSSCFFRLSFFCDSRSSSCDSKPNGQWRSWCFPLFESWRRGGTETAIRRSLGSSAPLPLLNDAVGTRLLFRWASFSTLNSTLPNELKSRLSVGLFFFCVRRCCKSGCGYCVGITVNALLRSMSSSAALFLWPSMEAPSTSTPPRPSISFS